MRAAVLAAPQAAAAQLRHQTAPSGRPAAAFVAARPQLQQRRASGSRSGRDARLLCRAAAQAAEGGKLISKVEIPAFIPRPDLIDQLVRWAMIEVQENGVANCGMPCKASKPTMGLPLSVLPAAAACSRYCPATIAAPSILQLAVAKRKQPASQSDLLRPGLAFKCGQQPCLTPTH